MPLFSAQLVLIRGGGDLASGVAYRLHKSGFPVVMTELAQPIFVRRAVSFGNAIYQADHRMMVEGITAVHVESPADVESELVRGHIPILIDPDGDTIQALQPSAILDARLQKSRLDIDRDAAPLVIALGPGYVAGTDCHAVIETNRGHTLGRVIWEGTAIPNTGTPGIVSGYGKERVLRAPHAGYVTPAPGIKIGSHLEQGTLIAHVGETALVSPFPGVLRGLIHPSVEVWEGLKIGDVDPRNNVQNCFTISDKALAIGGGVLEAILSVMVKRGENSHHAAL